MKNIIKYQKCAKEKIKATHMKEKKIKSSYQSFSVMQKTEQKKEII